MSPNIRHTNRSENCSDVPLAQIRTIAPRPQRDRLNADRPRSAGLFECARVDSNHHGENPPQGPQLRDLQGNIVATASLSATETKLLSTYNSTEFGVPSGKTATPTYAWLGATGLSSQLPSGTITQDGATYVPQTGRQLQTQPFDLPAPSKSIPAFTDAAPPGAAEEAAAAASIQETRYLEAKRAEELAANPPGDSSNVWVQRRNRRLRARPGIGERRKQLVAFGLVGNTISITSSA